jgi:YidC/Oxa1 family membrane protein insertase
MNTNNNFLIFIALSAALLLGFQYFYVKPAQERILQQQAIAATEKVASHETITPAAKPAAVASSEAVTTLRDRALVIKDTPRLQIMTPELKGSIDLRGARFDDLYLISYRETVDEKSPPVTLLSPSGSAPPYNSYYAEFGWLSDQPDIALPDSNTLWVTQDKTLSPEHPAHLTWTNKAGLNFERIITVDDHFMFTITDHVTNSSAVNLTLYPFGSVARRGNPTGRASAVLHEGPVGVLGGTLEELSYKKLMDRGRAKYESTGGWLGITDKYWLVAMAPEGKEQLSASYSYRPGDEVDPTRGFFQTDFRGSGLALAAGQNIEHVTRLFAGAKRFELLSSYSDKYNIPLFDRAIDFGWFWFLTIPFLQLLSYLGHVLGSYGIAILLFTVALKLITLPLSLKSNHSMARVKDLQPEINRLKERFADDKVRQNQEMMQLFSREKVSPLSGCVPTLIQIPIFFALYKVLYVGIELRQAPFYGWIKDMSLPDPTSVFNLFGYLPIDLPQPLHIGVWPILMGIGMFVQQKMSPQPTADKTQARMFLMMPVIFTYMLASMPAGLVIYWTWSNILSIAQQWYIMRVDAKRRGLASAKK